MTVNNVRILYINSRGGKTKKNINAAEFFAESALPVWTLMATNSNQHIINNKI